MTSCTFEDLLGLGLSERTAYIYARIVDRVETALAERGTDLASCTAVDLVAVQAGWGASRSSRGQLRAAVSRAWEVTGRLDGPGRAIRLPPKGRMRCLALEPADASRLEAAARARDDDAGLATLIGLYAGLRRTEIARARWDQLVVDAAGSPVWWRVHGKGDKTEEIPVHPELAELLADRARRTGWMFPARSGGHVVPNTVWAWIRTIGADVGLPGLRPHILRHTLLAEANDKSGDLRAVQMIARHAKPEQTSGYTRTTNARLQAVIRSVDYRRSA